MIKYILATLLIVTVFVACNNTPETVDNNNEDNWHYLFDGKNTHQWRSYNADTFPKGWIIQDSLLVLHKGGGDLITKEKYTNFELELEFQMTDTSNSGIFFSCHRNRYQSYLAQCA